jgi:hypothetical protein
MSETTAGLYRLISRNGDAVDRIRNALIDPVSALSGDILTLCGSDVYKLMEERDRYRSALAKIAQPSFNQIPHLRTIAREALS